MLLCYRAVLSILFASLQGNLEAEQAEARKREKAERKKKQEEERKQAEEEAAAAKARPCSYLLCYVAYCQPPAPSAVAKINPLCVSAV